MINVKQLSYINNIGQRPQLEDSIYPLPGSASAADNLFMVCDGVGGESMGEEASRIACEAFPAYFSQFPPPGRLLKKEYIQDAQKVVLAKMREFAVQTPEAQKMSTTLTLAYIGNNDVFVAWCGDSRIYHIRDGQVIWRSTDHSLVANLVKHGEITEEEARSHPQRNVITRSLSASGNVSEIDLHHIKQIHSGDYLMLCTDGVLEQIDEERLKGIVNSPEDKAKLFLHYCEGKTKDNFSLYLLQFEADRQPAPPTGKKSNPLIPILITLIVLVLAAFLLRGNIQHLLSGKNGKDTSSHTKASHPNVPGSSTNTISTNDGYQDSVVSPKLSPTQNTDTAEQESEKNGDTAKNSHAAMGRRSKAPDAKPVPKTLNRQTPPGPKEKEL